MSFGKSVLPKHPVIIRKLKESNTVSPLRKSNMTSVGLGEIHEDTLQAIIQQQKQLVRHIGSQVDELNHKNIVMADALTYFDNEAKKISLNQLIDAAKKQQEELITKIKNCEKVELSTTAEEYYLWQKRKKIQEHNHKLRQVLHVNK